jgi:hypothetical protein
MGGSGGCQGVCRGVSIWRCLQDRFKGWRGGRRWVEGERHTGLTRPPLSLTRSISSRISSTTTRGSSVPSSAPLSILTAYRLAPLAWLYIVSGRSSALSSADSLGLCPRTDRIALYLDTWIPGHLDIGFPGNQGIQRIGRQDTYRTGQMGGDEPVVLEHFTRTEYTGRVVWRLRARRGICEDIDGRLERRLDLDWEFCAVSYARWYGCVA